MSLIISIIVFLLIAAIVLWFVSYIVGRLPIDPMFRNIILALTALLLLLVFLMQTGLFTRYVQP
jgi:VIT1/CCC1 family predicted Fe2+/Mn2+ transporter